MKYQGEDLAQFPEQLRHVLENFTPPPGLVAGSFDNLLLAGLGGSGIAARILKALLYTKSNVPIEVVSDYTLPKYVGKRTLVILSSYSGSTEETLNVYNLAKEAGAQCLTLTTGGELGERSKRDDIPTYQAKTGFQPRMALGYSLGNLLLLSDHLFGTDFRSELLNAVGHLSNKEAYLSKADQLLAGIGDGINEKISVIADAHTYPVGLRFCQQVQENAKGECFLSELPEANHNVIETYYGKLPGTILLLQTVDVHPRTKIRFDYTRNILQKEGNKVLELNHVNTQSLLSLLETIYVLDWLSLLLAEAKNVNSAHIPNIKGLKEYLGAN